MTRLTPTLTGRETSFARGKWRPRDPFALVRRFYRGDTALSGRDYRLIVYRAGSDLLGRIGILVLTVTAARRLAPEAFGIFALGTTLGWLATVASDAGMQMHVARSVAARPASAAGLLHQWLRCRLLASLLVMTLVAVGIAAAGLPWPQRAPLVLLTVAGLATGLVELIHHAFRGLGRTDLESAISLGQRAASLVLGLAALWWRPEVTLLALVLIVPPLAALGISLAAAARVAGRANASPAFVPPVSWQEFRRDVAPIGIGILISALYFRIDTFLIDWLDGTARVGLYAAVFRIVDALRLLPAAALAVALPALCRAADLRVAMMLATRLTAVALVGAAVAAVAAPWLIPAMYGPAYAAAVPAFRVLLIGFPLMTLNYVLTQQLVAWNGHVAFAGLAAVALAVNVAANLTLIPSASIAGAAWSTVWTEVTITIGCTVILGTGQRRRSAASSPEGVPWQEA